MLASKATNFSLTFDLSLDLLHTDQTQLNSLTSQATARTDCTHTWTLYKLSVFAILHWHELRLYNIEVHTSMLVSKIWMAVYRSEIPSKIGAYITKKKKNGILLIHKRNSFVAIKTHYTHYALCAQPRFSCLLSVYMCQTNPIQLYISLYSASIQWTLPFHLIFIFSSDFWSKFFGGVAMRSNRTRFVWKIYLISVSGHIQRNVFHSKIMAVHVNFDRYTVLYCPNERLYQCSKLAWCNGNTTSVIWNFFFFFFTYMETQF